MKKYVVASGKGGVGKTTVCIAIARALAKRGRRVLLVDFDNLRSVDLLLGVADRVVYDWGDVVRGNCDAAAAVLAAQGVDVLPCPTAYDDLTPAAVKDFFRTLEQDYDVMLFDAPAGIGTGLRLACAAANRGIVVALADPVSVRSACKTAQMMETLGVTRSRLLLNRAVKRDIRRGLLLNVDDVIDKTEVQLLGIVPEDRDLRSAAIGGTIYDATQRSYTAFSCIAGRLEGENLPLSFI